MTDVDVKLSREESEHTDHSDMDLAFDSDLRRMSAIAMNALESITDEVNEITKKDEASPTKRSISLGDHFRSIAESDKQSSAVTPSPDKESSSNKIQHIDDIDVSDDEEDEFSLDGSIARELETLRSVTKQIEKELKSEDGISFTKAMSKVVDEPEDIKGRLLTSADREIIQKAIDEEMKNYEPKNALESFIKRYHLEGVSDTDKTIALATMCAIVWTIVLRLLYQVQYGEL